MYVDVTLGFVFFIKVYFNYKDIFKTVFLFIQVHMVIRHYLSFHLQYANNHMLVFSCPLYQYKVYHLNDPFHVVQFLLPSLLISVPKFCHLHQ